MPNRAGSLLSDIIELATDGSNSIGDVLRKCVVLSYEVDNQKLRDWANSELNGYGDSKDLPSYRKVTTVSKGFFVGAFNSSIQDQPLALAILDKKHRELVENAHLSQPIASYEGGEDGKISDGMIHWPPNLTLMYQGKFIRDMALNRAWQEIPRSVFVSLLETVRNRTLNFALELRKELGIVHDDVSKLSPSKVDQYVTNNFYGGNNVVSSNTRDISQVGSITISKGNFGSLSSALESLGISQAERETLQASIQEDSASGVPAIGASTASWLSQISEKLGSAGLSIGVEAAKGIATQWILQYLGMGF